MNLKKWLGIVSLVGLMLVFGSSRTAMAAEKEPSLQETLGWLKGKVNNEAQIIHVWQGNKLERTRIQSAQITQLEGTNIVLQATLQDDDINDARDFLRTVKITTVYAISLSVLSPGAEAKRTNPASPLVGFTLSEGPDPYYSLGLRIPNDDQKVNYHMVIETSTTKDGKVIEQKRSGEDGKSASINLYFSDGDVADRVAKAFCHAIQLSGGKEEPF